MKLLDLEVEHLSGVADGVYSFADRRGAPRGMVVLEGDSSSVLLQTIAALLEALRVRAPAAHQVAWWAQRRGPAEARVRARWALFDADAARGGPPSRSAVSAEWRFGAGDPVPRAIHRFPEGALAALARYVYIDASQLSVWMGADPLEETLAGLARGDVAAARVWCATGRGMVAMSAPNSLRAISADIAPLFPGLRLRRGSTSRGERLVECFRGTDRVSLDQLGGIERAAIHIAATLHTAVVRRGLVLIDRPAAMVEREACARWLHWLAWLAATNQLVVSADAAEWTEPCEGPCCAGESGLGTLHRAGRPEPL